MPDYGLEQAERKAITNQATTAHLLMQQVHSRNTVAPDGATATRYGAFRMAFPFLRLFASSMSYRQTLTDC